MKLSNLAEVRLYADHYAMLEQYIDKADQIIKARRNAALADEISAKPFGITFDGTYQNDVFVISVLPVIAERLKSEQALIRCKLAGMGVEVE